jgi:hypothetical protein
MSAPGARTRSARRVTPPVADPDLEGVRTQLDRAAAAVWLLDQIQNGELCFLTMRDPELPCWVSAPAAESMRPQDVAAWLKDIALTTVASALAEARAASGVGPSASRREAPVSRRGPVPGPARIRPGAVT